mgnify:FL=1
MTTPTDVETPAKDIIEYKPQIIGSSGTLNQITGEKIVQENRRKSAAVVSGLYYA